MTSSPGCTGLIFALVGPSGVGKNTLMRAAMERVPGLRQLPTATTRQKRENEQEGREHFFFSREGFQGLIESGRLLEHQIVHGEWYGILRETIETAIRQQDDLLADIDVLGAVALQREYPENAVLVFIAPPTKKALERRIRARGKISEEELARRMQRVDFEMQFAAQSDYLIINDDLEQAIQALVGVVLAEQSRRLRQGLTVSALIAKGSEVLVAERAGGTAAELPSTHVRPGESPAQAVQRLAQEIGVGQVTFLPRPAGEEDDSPSVHFQLVESAGRQVLNLIFACAPSRTSAVATGWHWQSIEAVPLAQSILRSRSHAALPES